jgi:hypothetical protein
MPKPTASWTVKQLKAYVRTHGLNTFGNDIKLNMRKAELQGRLKAIGHWDSGKPEEGVPPVKKRPAPPKRKTKKPSEGVPPKRAKQLSARQMAHLKMRKDAMKAKNRQRLKAGNGGMAPAPVTTAYQKARAQMKSGKGKK